MVNIKNLYIVSAKEGKLFILCICISYCIFFCILFRFPFRVLVTPPTQGMGKSPAQRLINKGPEDQTLLPLNKSISGRSDNYSI